MSSTPAKSKKSNEMNPEKFQDLLTDHSKRIQLHKEVQTVVERLHKIVSSLELNSNDPKATAKKFIENVDKESQSLLMMNAYGAYFGTPEQEYLWTSSLNRLAEKPHNSGLVFLLEMQLYPALLALYASGISAMASGNYTLLQKLLDTQIYNYNYGSYPLVMEAHCVMLGVHGNELLSLENRKTPLSDHLYELLAKTLPNEVKFGKDFELAFDEWEILLAMVYADFEATKEHGRKWAPVGRFSWRSTHSELGTLSSIKKQITENTWQPIIKTKLFGGTQARAVTAIDVVENMAKQVGWF